MNAMEAAVQLRRTMGERREARRIIIKYLREHMNALPDGNTQRRVMHYPSDLSDQRLLDLVQSVREVQ